MSFLGILNLFLHSYLGSYILFVLGKKTIFCFKEQNYVHIVIFCLQRGRIGVVKIVFTTLPIYENALRLSH